MSTEIGEARQQFVARSIAGQEKLLAIAAREKVVTGIAVIVMFIIVAIAIICDVSALDRPWPIWVTAVAGLALGWFAARHLRARRFIHSTTRAIARLRGL